MEHSGNTRKSDYGSSDFLNGAFNTRDRNDVFDTRDMHDVFETYNVREHDVNERDSNMDYFTEQEFEPAEQEREKKPEHNYENSSKHDYDAPPENNYNRGDEHEYNNSSEHNYDRERKRGCNNPSEYDYNRVNEYNNNNPSERNYDNLPKQDYNHNSGTRKHDYNNPSEYDYNRTREHNYNPNPSEKDYNYKREGEYNQARNHNYDSPPEYDYNREHGREKNYNREYEHERDYNRNRSHNAYNDYTKIPEKNPERIPENNYPRPAYGHEHEKKETRVSYERPAQHSGKDLKWISCSNIDLSPYNLSVPDRLEKFGYTVILDRSAARKIEKVELCILDVLMKQDSPRLNIIVFCPSNLMRSWYSALLSDLGVEFKFLNFDERNISFYSENCANLFIADSGQLYKSDYCKSISELHDAQMVWDLLIIDFPFSTNGADADVYLKEVKSKADKVIICAPTPSKYNESCDHISALAKSLLYRNEYAENAERYPIDISVLDFNANYPVLLDDGRDFDVFKVNTLYYAIDEAITQQSKRIDDIQTGIPVYTRGGNIFEEYSLEERKVYLHSEYNEKDIGVLCAADKKLKVFLNEITRASDDDIYRRGTVIVYAVSDKTINYLYKALSATFGSSVRVVRDNVTDFTSPLSEPVTAAEAPRVIITDDNAGWRFRDVLTVTHIFNYEYPDNPAVLQQRYLRRGRDKNRSPVFYIFIDTDYRFDGRILRKVVLNSLNLAFHRRIPAKNVLMYAEDIDRHISALLLDLKFINQYTREVGSSFDTVTRFRTEYFVSGGGNITTAAKTQEQSKKMLKMLTDMLGITDLVAKLVTGRSSDERALYEAVAEKVNLMRSGYAYLERDGSLKFLPKGRGITHDEFSVSLENNRFVRGLKRAEQALSDLSGENPDISYLRECTESLSDAMKMSVLISGWKYLWKTKRTDKSLAEFIRIFNRGMI